MALGSSKFLMGKKKNKNKKTQVLLQMHPYLELTTAPSPISTATPWAYTCTPLQLYMCM